MKFRAFIPGYPTWEMYGENEAEIRAQIRADLGLKRCPNDTYISTIDVDEEGRMKQHNNECRREVLRKNSWLHGSDL